MKLLLKAALGVWMLAAMAGGGVAQTRDRPLTLIVPFAPGAANDVLARTLGARVKDALGPVIVENKPGADAGIGAAFVKNAPPDGRTLLVAPNQYVILAAMGRSLPYDFVRDFEPIIYTNNLPFFLVVNEAALPAKTLPEMVKMVRAQPGKYSYGSAGNGSPHQLAAEMLKLQEKLDIVHVPYKGMAQGIPDFLEGRIQLVITGLPAVASHLGSGKLRILAMVGKQRSPLRSDVPTFAEAGVKNVEMDVWQGILAPAGTPKPAINAINQAFNAALKLPDVRQQFAAQGIDPVGGTPEEFKALIQADLARYQTVIKAAKIQPD